VTSVLVPPGSGARFDVRAPRTRGFRAAAALIGLFAFLVSVAWSWQPSYWGDEAASVMSAERSLSSLFRMLGHVDAVHGAYYVFLHVWIEVFGASELSTRMPSALAIGAAAAGTAVLSHILVNARVAGIAGLVFAVLPRVTYMGAEARSAALATAILVWATVILVRALQSGSRHSDPRLGRSGLLWWAAYAILMAAGIYMFLYVILLIPVHAIAVPLLHRREGMRSTGAGSPAPWRSWAVATTGVLALSFPVLFWGYREREQIAFIGRRPQRDLLDAAVLQWFGNVPLAIAAWALVVLAAVTVLASRNARASGVRPTGRVVTVMLAWMLVPSAVLLAGTHLVTPMYALRYLSMCAPAAAIVMAIGIACFRLTGLQVAALLVVVLLAVPTYVRQRGEFGKNGGSDWRQAATVLETKARASDAVVFDATVRPSRKPRLALHLYPDAFRGLRDITLDVPYDQTNGLWDRTVPLADVIDELPEAGTVWLVQYQGSRQHSDRTDVRALHQQGYSLIDSTTVNRTVIIEMSR
jgi:mannosyltransferase